MRTKRKRYIQLKENDRMIEPDKELFSAIKGRWNELYFHNNHPLVLELACGRGEYSVGLGQEIKEKNFIGVDKKGERMRVGIQQADELGLTNVAFLRTIIHHIDRFFEQDEVEEIRIIHPDPRPKGADRRRRLTHSRFLAMYETILVPGGLLKLKTDDTDLFERSCESLEEAGRVCLRKTSDLYASAFLSEHYGIKTNYENHFVAEGRTIKYGVRQSPQVKK